MEKFVYAFAEGSKDMRALLGGKGANLAEMTQIGLPVPPGFTISTKACNDYFENNYQLSPVLIQEIEQGLNGLQATAKKSFDGKNAPILLVSVRSGAVFSMPGMMDTILNLGLNDSNVESMAAQTGSRKFALDCYRRFIQMYSNVVLEVPSYHFERILSKVKDAAGIQSDQELSEAHLDEIIVAYKQLVQEKTGAPFEQDPQKQLFAAVKAVFKSWNNQRAVVYRKLNNIPDEVGTAVNVQMMVFGNMGDDSGTGVVFTRNPSTGAKQFFGEFLMNAQGEDVVAGIRTPQEIGQLAATNQSAFDALVSASQLLEKHYSNMQDIEFTIENGQFYLLQTRNGKRSAAAAIKIAVDLEAEGLIDKKEALKQIDVSLIDSLLHPKFDPAELEAAHLLALGLPASPGAASGVVCFNSKEAEALAEEGRAAILVREETSPEDIKGMVSAKGILTARGGMTSHAAVVARGMGKCCISGCSEAHIDEENKTLTLGDEVFNAGEFLSLDGTTGKVYAGAIRTISANIDADFQRVMSWAEEVTEVNVLANADTVTDAAKAREFGGNGIGLCRTEHMFFHDQRITDMREMIMAKNDQQRKAALEKLYPYQKEDFVGLFKVMDGLPVNIRLLDPPLHEFLPTSKEEMMELAAQLQVDYSEIESVANELKEVNPMMGLRGCRLGLLYPMVYEMQVRAIIDAALEAQATTQHTPQPEIMIPLVGNEKELALLRTLTSKVIAAQDPQKTLGEVKIGTMIEIPRACVTADEIANHADYFSFGTNDLTQMTFGFSRDDAGKFIRKYREMNVLENDPFQKIDVSGVGSLIQVAIEKGRAKKAGLKIGVCGEQSADPDSVHYLSKLGVDYVSCSPYRIPKAKLAAAQAALS